MVMDMSAKKQAREERLQAKKEIISEQKGTVDTDSESIPGEAPDTSLEDVPTEKAKVVDSPEVAQVKSATPRKGQAS